MINRIKELLSNDSDKISEILQKYGYTKFKSNGGNKLHFAFDDDSNGSCVIDIETLNFRRFSTGDSGSIFDAIMLQCNCGFKDSITILKNELNLSDESIMNIKPRTKISDMFSGLENDLNMINGEFKYTSHDVDMYEQIISQTLLDDGIGSVTQDRFDVRYDYSSDRIVFLWKDIEGNVVGCNGRANYDNYGQYKYVSLLPFQKREYLFGLYDNINEIKKSRYAMIVESEKTVMQCSAFGFYNVVGIGSSTFTKEQFELLYNEGIRHFVLSFDEDKDYLHCINTSENMFKWRSDITVRCVIDLEKKYMKQGSKVSISDMGEETFNKLITEKVIELQKIND